MRIVLPLMHYCLPARFLLKLSVLIVIVLFLGQKSKAQTDSNDFQLIIKWTPSKLFEPRDPTIFLNAELVWKERISFSGGYGQKCFIWDNSNYFFNRYYKANAEMLYFFFRLKPVMFFAGLNAFYINRYYANNFGYVFVNDTFYNYTYAEKAFKVKGAYGLFGIRASENHFMMELYAGLGIRQREIDFSDVENPVAHDGFFEWVGPGRDSYSMIDNVWHFSLGARIGVVF